MDRELNLATWAVLEHSRQVPVFKAV